jgi:hypothetical protein
MTQTNSIFEYAGIAWSSSKTSNEDEIEDIADYDEIVNFDETLEEEESNLPQHKKKSGWKYALPAFVYTAVTYITYILFKNKDVYKKKIRRRKRKTTEEVVNYCQ